MKHNPVEARRLTTHDDWGQDRHAHAIEIPTLRRINANLLTQFGTWRQYTIAVKR